MFDFFFITMPPVRIVKLTTVLLLLKAAATVAVLAIEFHDLRCIRHEFPTNLRNCPKFASKFVIPLGT